MDFVKGIQSLSNSPPPAQMQYYQNTPSADERTRTLSPSDLSQHEENDAYVALLQEKRAIEMRNQALEQAMAQLLMRGNDNNFQSPSRSTFNTTQPEPVLRLEHLSPYVSPLYHDDVAFVNSFLSSRQKSPEKKSKTRKKAMRPQSAAKKKAEIRPAFSPGISAGVSHRHVTHLNSGILHIPVSIRNYDANSGKSTVCFYAVILPGLSDSACLTSLRLLCLLTGTIRSNALDPVTFKPRPHSSPNAAAFNRARIPILVVDLSNLRVD